MWEFLLASTTRKIVAMVVAAVTGTSGAVVGVHKVWSTYDLPVLVTNHYVDTHIKSKMEAKFEQMIVKMDRFELAYLKSERSTLKERLGRWQEQSRIQQDQGMKALIDAQMQTLSEEVARVDHAINELYQRGVK